MSPVRIQDYKCSDCTKEDCESCFYDLAYRRTLNLQEIEEVLVGYGLQPYEIDNLVYRMKEKMRDLGEGK